MILNDRQIRKLCPQGTVYPSMIDPFCPKNDGTISNGLSSFGYDITLASELQLFVKDGDCIIDPKNFHPTLLKLEGDYFILPPNSFALGRTVERFIMPQDVIAICVGKSTYARCGLIINVTPIEPGWEGYITLELHNTTPYFSRVYANEGIGQLLFFKGERPDVTYSDKKGKYQKQVGIVGARA